MIEVNAFTYKKGANYTSGLTEMNFAEFLVYATEIKASTIHFKRVELTEEQFEQITGSKWEDANEVKSEVHATNG